MTFDKGRVWRLAGTAAAAGLLALAGSGCVRATAEFEVAKDATIGGSVVVAVSDKAINALTADTSQDPSQVKDWITEQVTGSFEPMAPGAKAAAYSQDGYTGVKLTFEDVDINDFGAGPDGIDLTVEHDQGEFKLAGQVQLPGADDFFGGAVDPASLGAASDATMSLSFTFPGPVTATDGAASGNTVTWDLKLGQTTQINAIAKDSAFPWLMVVIIAGGGLIFVILVVILLVLVRKRSKAAKQADLPAALAQGHQDYPPPATPSMMAPGDGPPSAPPAAEPYGSPPPVLDRFAPPSTLGPAAAPPPAVAPPPTAESPAASPIGPPPAGAPPVAGMLMNLIPPTSDQPTALGPASPPPPVAEQTFDGTASPPQPDPNAPPVGQSEE